MATTYTVTGRAAAFGVGMVLALSPSQAEARKSRLSPCGAGAFRVVEPVEFKAGESITVIFGDVPKTAMANLAEESARDEPEPAVVPGDGAGLDEKETPSEPSSSTGETRA